MKDELIARGIDPEVIIVNPNGVDPDTYSPAVDGTAVRQRFDLVGKRVVGFIGTFGPWHGAEVLAAAYGGCSPAARPPQSTRLFMIGDGSDWRKPAGASKTRVSWQTPSSQDAPPRLTARPTSPRAMSSSRPTCQTRTARRSSARPPSSSSTWRWASRSSLRISIRSARSSSTTGRVAGPARRLGGAGGGNRGAAGRPKSCRPIWSRGAWPRGGSAHMASACRANHGGPA